MRAAELVALEQRLATVKTVAKTASAAKIAIRTCGSVMVS